MNRSAKPDSPSLTAARALWLVGALLLSGGARADAPVTTPRFERSLTPGGAGPNRVDVDVDLLAGAEPEGGLADVRLYDAKGQEVPYVLVPKGDAATQEWLTGRVSVIPREANRSGFEVDLGRQATVDRLRLSGLPRPFLKGARVEGSGDHAHYTELVREATLFDLPAEELVGLEVPLPEGDERYIRLTWDDRATRPLPLPDSVAVRRVTKVTPAEPLRAVVPFERRPSRAGESRFRVKLPGPRLPLMAIELEVGGGLLLREARVVAPTLKGGEVVPVDLGHARLRRSFHDGMSAAALRIPVAARPGGEVDLSVDDGDNPPLDLRSVTAVFAPQPWIFFEAPSTEPLRVRYGTPRLQAPHYDLEAARGDLGRLSPSLARWGTPVASTPVASPATAPAVPLVGAPLDPTGFEFSRAVRAPSHPEAGLAAVGLDAAALAHAPALSDLRILEAGGGQIPYVLERQDEPLLVDLSLTPIARSVPGGPSVEPRSSLYRVDLPFPSLPNARVVLTTKARIFRRQVTLLAPRAAAASPRDPDVRTLEVRSWTHASLDGDPPPLAFALPTTDATAVYFRVDEGDNAPLALAGVRLELPGLRVRFFRPAEGALTLLYGNPAMGAPSYDLALLAPSLAGAVSDELSLGPEVRSAPSDARPAAGMKVFFGVLAVAVVALLGVMAALLRKDAGGEKGGG